MFKLDTNTKMKDNHISHVLLMALACGGAVLLIVVLPFLGLPKNWSVGIAIAAMMLLHVWMMKEHSHNHSHNKRR